MPKSKGKDDSVIIEQKNNENYHQEYVEKKEEKALFIQRFAAFILDIMIISIVTSIISYPFMDSQALNKLNEESVQIIEDYTSNKITMKEYISENTSIMYETARKQGINSFIGLFLSILYFVVFQTKNNGQTLGKQALKIKVVSSDDSEISMNQMIFRSLIINSILINMISFGVLVFSNQNFYFYSSFILGILQFLILFISAIMVMYNSKRRGLHDLVAHTDVVRCDLVKEMKTCKN